MQRQNAIRAVKERLSIVDFISRYVELKPNGSRWSGPCPFHQETKPSFFVDEERGTFYCFGCQATGDIFEFYQKITGSNFIESLKALAGEVGISLENNRNLPKQRQKGQWKQQRQLFLEMYNFATNFFKSEMLTNSATVCRHYLAERGVDSKLAEQFDLGWAANSWHKLKKALEQHGFSSQYAVQAGLLGSNDKNCYDRFRARLIFPIKDSAGKVIAFGGRILTQTGTEPKYINSSDSIIYKKGEHLYGLYQARSGILDKKKIILTEGYLDVISLHQFGYNNAVGVLGTALTDRQIKKLMRFSSNFLLVFDGDAAGQKATFRSGEMLLKQGMNCQVAILPDGEDIDSLLHNQGVASFEKILTNALDGLQFCLDVMLKTSPKDLIGWIDAFLNHLNATEFFELYFTRIADHLHLSDKELRHKISNFKTQSELQQNPTLLLEDSPNFYDQQILTVGINYPEKMKELCSLGIDLLTQSDVARSILDKLYKNPNPIQEFNENEKIFWKKLKEDTPLDNPCGFAKLHFLRQQILSYYKFLHESAVFSSMNTDSREHTCDKNMTSYLQELQIILEQKNEYS